MTTKSAIAPPQPHLGHSMKPRQLTMMGLGSAIGAGLFLGSGAGVRRLARPCWSPTSWPERSSSW